MKSAKILILIMIFVIGCFALPGQKQKLTTDTNRSMEIINLRLIIHALRDGQPVKGLKASDFILNE